MLFFSVAERNFCALQLGKILAWVEEGTMNWRNMLEKLGFGWDWRYKCLFSGLALLVITSVVDRHLWAIPLRLFLLGALSAMAIILVPLIKK